MYEKKLMSLQLGFTMDLYHWKQSLLGFTIIFLGGSTGGQLEVFLSRSRGQVPGDLTFHPPAKCSHHPCLGVCFMEVEIYS